MVLISIIIPIYNAEKSIKECIESIISQTYKNIEIICINDGSTDNSLNIIEEYANKDKRRKDWDEIKVGIMEELLRCKIEQNPYVKKKLLETKDYTIVEDSPKDSFWGWGEDRNGNNQLGKLWMKLRDEIKKL